MLWRVEAGRIATLARGREGYTGAQYAITALKLLDSAHRAIAKEDVLAQLGRHSGAGDAADENEVMLAGERVFQHLVEANALSLRPQSGEAYTLDNCGTKSYMRCCLSDSFFDPPFFSVSLGKGHS